MGSFFRFDKVSDHRRCDTRHVSGSIDELTLVDEASSFATQAAKSAGVRVTELTSLDDLAAAADLYDTVWSSNSGSQLPLGVLRALSYSHNYNAGAFSGDELVGAATGFRGEAHGVGHLHSHVLGVLPDSRSRNVGYALKLHQRAWALGQGFASVIWTFDPLVAKNAYFNLTKLGAGAGAYLTNFYGEMNDAQNAGEESDRLVVEWDLDSDKAIAAGRGQPSEPDLRALQSAGASVVLEADGSGGPVTNDAQGRTLLFKIPSDIVAMRSSEPQLARQWRMALRETLGRYLSGESRKRYEIEGVSKSGWYVLRDTRG